jgi:hypothetical protein
MGPKLKLKIESQGVRLHLGIDKEKVGSPPRLAQQFVSTLESIRKWLVLRLDLSSKKPALLNQYLFPSRGSLHYGNYSYPFTSAFSQQLAKTV